LKFITFHYPSKSLTVAHLIRIQIRQQIDRFKKSFLQVQKLPFNDFFPIETIATIIAHTPHKRTSVFSPLITLKAFIFQVLGDDGSCKQAVAGVFADRLSQGQSANSVNTGPYGKARQRLPLAQMTQAVATVGSRLHQLSAKAWRWRGLNVVLVDGTTALMPDTPKNQAVFPQQSHQKPGLGFPIVRLLALISLSTGTVIDYRLGPYQGKGTGESSLFSQVMDALSAGDLLLADRYYCTFAIVALLQAQGIPVLFLLHANKKADFRQGRKLGARDHEVDWQKPKRKPVWMTEQDYAELPAVIPVREFSVNGVVYVTTLLNAKRFHKQALASLYKERWKIELDFRAIKTYMGMEMLRCKTPGMVQKEITVHLLAYNIIRGNLAQAAVLHDKIPRQLSFRSSVQLIGQAAKQIGLLVGKSLTTALLALSKAIAATLIGLQNRKKQPRAIKRRPKPFPLLTIPRHQACLSL
jgi:Transposase DDE domain